MLARGLFAAVVVAGGAGCSYRTPEAHFPVSFPAIAVRDDAVRLEVVSHGQPRSDSWAAKRLRPWVVEVLSRAATARAASALPARVTVRVDLRDEFFWMKACPVVCLVPALLGVDSGYVTLAVDVTIETDDRRYAGHGLATQYGGLYAPADKRALATALDRALALALPVAP